jgi:hypothetical protein
MTASFSETTLGAQLLASDKFISLGIHRKEISFHANECPLVAFHSADEMASNVIREKLPIHRLMCTYAIADADAR